MLAQQPEADARVLHPTQAHPVAQQRPAPPVRQAGAHDGLGCLVRGERDRRDQRRAPDQWQGLAAPASAAVLKELPQAQVVTAWGFWTLKPPPISAST